MADKILDKEMNVTTVCEEDKLFIRALTSLSPEKRILVKGILIGMDLQEKPSRPDDPRTMRKRKVANNAEGNFENG